MCNKINKNQWVGMKFRNLPYYNYSAMWNNLVTVRFDKGEVMELPPDKSEFYDVSLGNKCTTGNCPFCYVAAKANGKYYEGICETWKKWMATYADKYTVGSDNCLTLKPLQIAVGSEGEPLEHPDICDFLKTVYETNVVPNYTTNGVILSYWDKPGSDYYEKANRILEATAKYCGGVAVSFGNKALRSHAKDAIRGLIEKGDCHVMIHHIISDMESVDEFVECWKEYGEQIKNHVLLPLMPSGRSKKGIENNVFEYMENAIEENNIKNVAFGAHFIKYLEKSDKIKTWLYPAESYSKNVLLKKDKVVITPSSFNLSPIMEIDLSEVTDEENTDTKNVDNILEGEDEASF